jgi:hypothetical protein
MNIFIVLPFDRHILWMCIFYVMFISSLDLRHYILRHITEILKLHNYWSLAVLMSTMQQVYDEFAFVYLSFEFYTLPCRLFFFLDSLIMRIYVDISMPPSWQFECVAYY